MKKKFKVFPILFFAIIAMVIYQSCKKEKKDSGEIRYEKVTSPELLAKIKAFQDVQMKEGITIMTRRFEPGEIVGRIKNQGIITDANCIGDIQLELSSVYAEYKNGTCNSFGSYYMYFVFSLRHQEITLVNENTLPIRIKYTINNVNFEKVLSISSLKSSRSVTTYITAPIVVGEYCEINLLNLEVDPTVTCPDNQNYSGTISVQANILTDRTNQCKNVAPGFVQPNISGQGTVGLNGYYPCQNTQYNPCFTLPDQMVFYYRKVGNSDWNSLTLNPFSNNATVISGLQAGNYEFKRANKQGTSPFCMGPESDVVTVTVN